MARAFTEKNIVVTGMGAVSSLGYGVDTLWEALVNGRCGIGPLTRLDAARYRIGHCGEVPPMPDDTASDAPDLAIRYLVVAAEEALNQAGLQDEERRTTALVAASNFGPMQATERFLGPPENGTWRTPGGVFHDEAVRLARQKLRLSGPGTAISLSCASGNAAIGYAADLLRAGQAEAVVAVGYDAVSEIVWAGLCALRAMSRKALLPFDSRRDGTIFSEGAGALVLEAESHATARGARPLARYLGCGTSSNAFHMTHPDPRGEGMVRAMRAALRDAGIGPEQVDHINAHATGTKPNDRLETAAIKAIFGEHASRIAVNGIKAMLGHAMGAAGALEAIAAVMTLREGIIPPTIGLEQPDPDCDLDAVPLKARRAEVRTALNNSAGFGGCNASVVLQRWEEG